MQHNVGLTSSELSHLWLSYQNDSMAVCGIRHFLTNVEDIEIREVLLFALKISAEHLEKITEIFNNAKFPIPEGFTENDVNLDAPRLFSDKLYLEYIVHLGKFGLAAYSTALTAVARGDIIEYFSSCLEEVIKLHNHSKKLLIKKGLYIRPPFIPTPNQVDFVKKNSFLSGWGNRRPLLGIEITNLVYSAKRNALGQALITGFSQVAKHKEIRKYFERGRDISGKHFDIFTMYLKEEFLGEGSIMLTSEVTESNISPFSDKLMLTHVTLLIASGIGQYGLALSSSARADLALMYTRLMGEIASYAEDGATILIDHEWMEQPPKASDRKELS